MHFNHWVQQQGETIDSLIHSIAEHWIWHSSYSNDQRLSCWGVAWCQFIGRSTDGSRPEIGEDNCTSMQQQSCQVSKLRWKAWLPLMHFSVVINTVQFHSKGKDPHFHTSDSAVMHSSRKEQLNRHPPTHRCHRCGKDWHSWIVAQTQTLNADDVV